MVVPVMYTAPALAIFTLSMRGKSFSPKELGLNLDEREVLLHLESVIGHHNAPVQPTGIRA